MKKSSKFLMFFLSLALLAVALPAAAHAPRLLDNDGSVIIIDQPEVSQAFYGDLNGGPAYFSLRVDKPMDLYVSILVPNISGVEKNKSVLIKYDNQGKDEVFWELDGKKFVWRPMFEKFAGDNYFQGPEIRKSAPAGEYFLTVYSSPSYTGKYVLLVGEKESFTVTEIVNTIFTLPTLKKDFFGTSLWTAYFNFFGLFMLAGLIVLVIIYFVLVAILKKIFPPKEAKLEKYTPKLDDFK